ncbi:transposase [Tardisphaera miroshnichenkoae]
MPLKGERDRGSRPQEKGRDQKVPFPRYKRWKEQTDYGKRWAVEGFFSAMKRKFGEDTTARKPETITAEQFRGLGHTTRWPATRELGRKRKKQEGKGRGEAMA